MGRADSAPTALQPALTTQTLAVSTPTAQPEAESVLATDTVAMPIPILVSSSCLSVDRQDEQSRKESCCSFNKENVRVLSGAPISFIYVGNIRRYGTYAQNPPKMMDSWEATFDAEPGGYEIVFVGGKNPHHGILDVTVDSEEIGSIDQYTQATEYKAEQPLYWECHAAGQHTLRGTVTSKSPHAVNYWICLCEIVFRPVPR